MSLKTIKDVTNYLDLKEKNVKYDSDGSIPIRTKDNVKIRGYYNIIVQLLKEANVKLNGVNEQLNEDSGQLNQGSIINTNLEKIDRFQLKQWLDYISLYVNQTNGNHNNLDQILTELNDNLSTKTYMLGNKLTIVDVVLYSALYDSIATLNNLEKEHYMNLSRWYDHIQNDNKIRMKNDLIKFNTIHLSNVYHKNK